MLYYIGTTDLQMNYKFDTFEKYNHTFFIVVLTFFLFTSKYLPFIIITFTNICAVVPEEPLICLPGQRLAPSNNIYTSGHGTFERQGYIYSQLTGTVDIVEKDNVKIVEVHSAGEETVVPAQGDIVTAQITILTQQFCKCLIKCVGDTVLRRPFKGLLRKEDIRATEKDKVEVYKSFRPGDVILARVVSFISFIIGVRY